MAQSELGDFKRALETVERMESGSRDGALSEIFVAVALTGQYKRAGAIAKGVNDQFSKASIFVWIADAQAGRGATDAALRTATKLVGHPMRATALMLIVVSRLESGNIGAAHRTTGR